MVIGILVCEAEKELRNGFGMKDEASVFFPHSSLPFQLATHASWLVPYMGRKWITGALGSSITWIRLVGTSGIAIFWYRSVESCCLFTFPKLRNRAPRDSKSIVFRQGSERLLFHVLLGPCSSDCIIHHTIDLWPSIRSYTDVRPFCLMIHTCSMNPIGPVYTFRIVSGPCWMEVITT